MGELRNIPDPEQDPSGIEMVEIPKTDFEVATDRLVESAADFIDNPTNETNSLVIRASQDLTKAHSPEVTEIIKDTKYTQAQKVALILDLQELYSEQRVDQYNKKLNAQIIIPAKALHYDDDESDIGDSDIFTNTMNSFQSMLGSEISQLEEQFEDEYDKSAIADEVKERLKDATTFAGGIVVAGLILGGLSKFSRRSAADTFRQKP